MSVPGPEDRIYPEFDGMSAREIRVRLEALDNLLNSELEAEYQKGRSGGEDADDPGASDSDEAHAPAMNDDFIIIAHRGWSGSYPENTLIGMREAIKLGCHMIEFDVSHTKDRRPIIIHDHTLSRTTNGCGLVNDFDFAELRDLDAGSWFHPRYAGARLPSLDEVLLISRGSGIMVNIEIKKEFWDEEQQPDSLEVQVVEAVRKYSVEDRVVISSFRWGFIERIHDMAPELKTALLHYKGLGPLNPAKLKEKYGVYSFNPHSIELNKKFVDQCHDAGLKVFPFTINSYKDMEVYVDMDVDGLFTNHPNRLFRFIEDHGRHIQKLHAQEKREDVQDMDEALKKLEMEEMDKARRRARWRAKRMILEARRSRASA